MRTCLLTIVLIVLQATSFSQNQMEVNDSVGRSDYISIDLNAIVSSPFSFDNSGADLVQSKYLWSGELGMGYERKLNENWRWHSSLTVGLMPYNLNFNIDAPANSIFQTGPYKDDYKTLDFNWSEYDYIRLYASLDATVSRKIATLKSGGEFALGAGLRAFMCFVNEFEYEYSSTWYIDDTNPEVQLFYANVFDTSSNRLSGAVLLEASFLKQLKHDRIFKTTLSFSYSPFKSIRGYYYFSNLGFPSSGTLSQTMTYASLRFSYLLPLEGKNGWK